MNMTRHTESVEVIFKDQRRRRWSLAEKSALVRRTYEPGMSVSLVALMATQIPPPMATSNSPT